MRLPKMHWKQYPSREVIVFAGIGIALLLPFLIFPSADELSKSDIARVAEFHHLRQTLGDAVWPGFGTAPIPFAMLKGKREYLFDHPSPAKGNIPVNSSLYAGSITYIKGKTVPSLVMTAMPIEGIPTAVLPDKSNFDQVISLVGSSSEGSLLEAAMDGGAGVDSAIYELVAIHEEFHVFQLKQGIDRIEKKFDLPPGSLEEKIFRARLQEAEAAKDIQNMLRNESRHLAQALAASDPNLCREEALLFLKMRDARRKATAEKEAGLTVASIAANEDSNEWTEGAANYVQYRMLQLAAGKGYEPSDFIKEVSGFHGYKSLQMSKALSLDRSAEMSNRARSYSVGAGICSLLDRLGAEWKSPAIEELMPLTELLRQTLENRSVPDKTRTWTPLSKRNY
jgi:hypothetical protein